MTSPLRILQLNTMRSRASMEALINNTKTLDLDILLIQEPLITKYKTHVQHRCWQLYQPTTTETDVRKKKV